MSDTTRAPESGVDSGATAPSGAESASRPAPAADPTPEPGADHAPVGAEDPIPNEGTGIERELAAVVDPDPGDAAARAGDGIEEAQAAPAGDGAEADLAALTARAQKADEYLGVAQRTKADFENYRKRAMREAAAARERGAVKLALELLPAIDNLDRALAHADSADEAQDGAGTLVSGIKHVRTDVLAALGRVGIEPYSPEGEPFDPRFHEAVAQAPVEGAEPGTVVEVYQRGYRLGESVLRPARVVVAAG